MAEHYPVIPGRRVANGGHQKPVEKQVHVGDSYEASSIGKGDSDFDYGFPSLSTWGDDSEQPSDKPKWESLVTRFVAEFFGTAIQVFMISILFFIVYNAQIPVTNLVNNRLADYLLVIFGTALTATATHAGFWGESCKYNPFLSLATIPVAQSIRFGWGMSFARALVEIVAQLVGGILGAAIVWWIEPSVLTRTYFATGYPFFDYDLTSNGAAVGLQIVSQALISYVFCRTQYGKVKKTHLQAQSVLMGYAYGGAAAVTYYTGSCTTFARWFGSACVTGIFNIRTAATTTADALADNVASPGWVYLTGDLVGNVLGAILIYLLLFRPQTGTRGGKYFGA